MLPNEIIFDFEKLLIEYNLIVPLVKLDTQKKQRCKAVGDGANEKSGMYYIFSDFPYNFGIKNYRTGLSIKSNFAKLAKTHGRIQSPSNLLPKASKSLEKYDKYDKIAFVANKIWQSATTDFNDVCALNNYMHKKKVAQVGRVRYEAINNSFIVPVQDLDNKIWNIQRIYSNNEKRFLSNGKKAGLMCWIPEAIDDFAYAGEIFIAEGYATAASIHMATNKPSVVVFDANNLSEACKSIRQRYLQAILICCLDADFAGISAGLTAAPATKAKIVLPFLSSKERGLKINDFNDVHCIYGLATLKHQIYTQLPLMKQVLQASYDYLHKTGNSVLTKPEFIKFNKLIHAYIEHYFIIKAANSISKIVDFKLQLKELSSINSKYLTTLKSKVIELIAGNLFYNRVSQVNPELKNSVYDYIENILLQKTIQNFSNQPINVFENYLKNINSTFHAQLRKLFNLN